MTKIIQPRPYNQDHTTKTIQPRPYNQDHTSEPILPSPYFRALTIEPIPPSPHLRVYTSKPHPFEMLDRASTAKSTETNANTANVSTGPTLGEDSKNDQAYERGVYRRHMGGMWTRTDASKRALVTGHSTRNCDPRASNVNVITVSLERIKKMDTGFTNDIFRRT
jgi:hypothetical protein